MRFYTPLALFAAYGLFTAASTPCWANINNRSINAVTGGLSVMRFDSKIKVTPDGQQIPFFLDLEGNLKLPASNQVAVLGYEKRYRDRYWNFNYFGINRESDFFTDSITIKGEEIANVDISLEDKTRFYGFTLGAPLTKTKHNQVSFEFGLFTADMSIKVDALGEEFIDPETRKEYQYHEHVEFFLPLPLVGMNVTQRLSSKWSLSTQVSALVGKTSKAQGSIFSTNITSHYALNSEWYLLFNLGYFDLRAKVQKQSQRQEVEYGYAGLGLGLRYVFKNY